MKTIIGYLLYGLLAFCVLSTFWWVVIKGEELTGINQNIIFFAFLIPFIIWSLKE
jgi:hypothetical protein|tara:strand:- start:644 stop:808 length:165 start_codon:yes stop_codon:yes gene_type:complete